MADKRKNKDADSLRFPPGPPSSHRPGDYDIAHLLRYKGPSHRQQEPFEDGVFMVELRDTDENERKVERLLSARSIPFYLERSQQIYAEPKARMTLNVPMHRYEETAAIITRASQESQIDVVEGTDGLVSY